MAKKAPLPFSSSAIPPVPKMSKHKASGLSVVRLNGRDCYLGEWGTQAAKAEYDRLIGHWLANGRRIETDDDLRISELVEQYLNFARGYYSTEGETGEVEPLERALIPLGEIFGRERANDFGPLKLKALRQRWIDEGRVRQQINAAVRRVIRAFKWGVENELVRGEILHALKAVAGLRAGKSTAKESKPIEPVAEDKVDAALPFMAPPVRAMVELQRNSGMRPGEVVQMTSAAIDRSGPVWVYRPARHKTQHHGRDRLVFLGPKCQAILEPYLAGREPTALLFSPAEAMEAIRLQRAAERKTPASRGNRRGTNRVRRPKRAPGVGYTVVAYAGAIARACMMAWPLPPMLRKKRGETAATWRQRIGPLGVAEIAMRTKTRHWHPNQLRHAFATRIRKAHDLEAAQVLLGHARADVTQIYAERDAAKAAAVAAVIG